MKPSISANDLIFIAHKSIDPNFDYSTSLNKLEEEYLNWAKLTIPVVYQSGVLSNIRYTFNEIESLCKGIQLLSVFPEKTKVSIAHYPAKLSSYIQQEEAKLKNVVQ